MEKTIKIDLSSDRLIAVAADMVDEHNYIGALKMLNKNADMNGNDFYSYMLYAEIFDDCELYEKSINSWYKYIDCSQGNEVNDAYEGLAVDYMNLGNEHFSAYYYNKLLMDADELDAETRGEIMNSFLSREQNPLKFVYPPKIADCSEIISNGIDLMKDGDYDKAIEEFDKVEEGNGAYLSARNYIAMCNIISDKCDEAEQECLNILKTNPDSVQALTTLAAVRTEQKRSAESRELAKKLISLKVTSNEEIYKIATVCCESKMHEEAYNLFCKLEDELTYDISVLFFKAVSAFNSGKFDESFSAFDKLLTISPDAVTARCIYDTARKSAEAGEKTELSYFYRMPQTERESSLKILASFAKMKDAEAKKFLSVVDITDCILWCFDESEGGGNGELQFLASMCAVKAGLDGIVSDILLNAFLPDSLKVKTLSVIGERNEENSFGTVVCHLYKRVSFYPLNLGRAKRKNFISAYSRLTAHFSIIDDSYGLAFKNAAESLYRKLEEEGRLSCASDLDALTASVYWLAGIDEQIVSREKISAFFDTTDKKIFEILGEI